MEEINELKREGLSTRTVSQLTGYDRKMIAHICCRRAVDQSTDLDLKR